MYSRGGRLEANVSGQSRSNWTAEKIGKFCSFGVTFEFARPNSLPSAAPGANWSAR